MLRSIWCVVMIVDHLLPCVLARFYPSYRPKEMPLSVLGSRQSPVKWIYNLWCIVSGVVFCVAPTVLFEKYTGGLMIAIYLLLVIYGVGCEILSGVFPLNEKREEEDLVTKIHGGGSVIGFMALWIVPLLLAIRQFGFGEIGWGVFSLVGFFVASVFFCCFVLGEKEVFAHTALRYGGLWQRLVLVACYLPLATLCLQNA